MNTISMTLTVVWLFVGVVMLCWEKLLPGQPQLLIPGTNLSAGWLALLLAIYNFVRWWSRKVNRKTAKKEQAALYSRLHQRRPLREPADEPDPNFMFRDEPPKEEEPKK